MPRPTAHLALASVVVALAVAACGGAASTPLPSAATPTTAPSATVGTPTPPAPTTVPGGDDRTPVPSPGTFETAWGEAWDGLPPGFPVPAGAAPAEPGDPADGPVSGAYVVDLAAEDAAAAQQAGLAAAGFSTEALSGPSEDGALVIDSIGRDPACRVQTTVRPLGGTTMMTVLYGAACPWD